MRPLLLTLLCVWAVVAQAQVLEAQGVHAPELTEPTTGEAAETLRSSLVQAQLALGFDEVAMREHLDEAATAWALLSTRLPSVRTEVDAWLELLPETEEEAGFAAARAAIWTALLRGGQVEVLKRIVEGDAAGANDLLGLREFRRATRFSRPGNAATLAVAALAAGSSDAASAADVVRANLLDAYQARLNDALIDLRAAIAAGYQVRTAEQAALARGYFTILAPAYAEQRGAAALAAAEAAFAGSDPGAMSVALQGFRASPLSLEERRQRASRIVRFLDLVAIEYSRGVRGSEGEARVTNDLEIVEANTFFASAQAAFADLEPLLQQLDAAATAEVSGGFDTLTAGLQAATAKRDPPTVSAVQAQVSSLLSGLRTVLPADWQTVDPGADLEVIRQQLQALLEAAAQGSPELAETARLDAYAVLESGPEARLRVFAPQLSLTIEELFWNGLDPKGLARLLREGAPQVELRATVSAIDEALERASAFLQSETAPATVAANAAIIVFREGLEAVLILAALLGSLKRPEVRRFRAPLWLGAALGLLASVVTWFIMRGVLTRFARYGEKLEAVVGIAAILVLLLIMNWYFHQVYWTDHLAGLHKRKTGLLGAGGQSLGLALLGLSAIYREGFETVLFLQSLVLQSGSVPVLLGTAIGFAATAAVGAAVWVLQARLPYKRMLVVTGVMICAVLAIMVGNTVQTLQLVGWLPLHPLPIGFPFWLGMWFGVHATWEGVLLQVFAVVLVIGSYFLAEAQKAGQRRARFAAG